MKEVNIAGLACSGAGGVQASLDRASNMIAEACFDKADIVCLPEIFAWTALQGEEKLQAAEQVDGPFCQAMASVATKHNVNILTALLEREDDRVYNSMIWLDRQGKVVGTYRKTFPTDYEMREGISPGVLDFEVFHTEFGPIGCCICFDLNFREVIENIASQKAKLVFFPSMFSGVGLMRAWSRLYGMHFVSVAGDIYGTAVNPLGVQLVEPWNHGPIMALTLNLDYVVLATDYNKEKFPAIKEAYGSAVEIDWMLIESCALLASRHPEKSAADIVAEFSLELEEEYFARSAEERKKRL